MLPEEIRAFQRSHRNHLGAPLRVDGLLGPETQWARAFETICSARQGILLAAQHDAGLTEHPPRSNSSTCGTIQRWQKRCGARPGDPWCASGLSQWLSAAVPVRIAGALALGRYFRRVERPFPGDIASYPTDGRGHGHCFLVIGVDELVTQLMAFEANCGDAVRCTRRLFPWPPGMEFSRIVDDVSGTCPGIVPSVPLAPGGTR
jgi:hypothetical protein